MKREDWIKMAKQCIDADSMTQLEQFIAECESYKFNMSYIALGEHTLYISITGKNFDTIDGSYNYAVSITKPDSLLYFEQKRITPERALSMMRTYAAAHKMGEASPAEITSDIDILRSFTSLKR